MVSKTTFETDFQAEAALDEHLTQQLVHIKKWLFIASGMVAMFWLMALSDISFPAVRPWLFFPGVWLLLWMLPLGLGIYFLIGRKWRQTPFHLRHEFIIWSFALSWLTISALLFNEMRENSLLDSTIMTLLAILPGLGLWLLNRWLLKKVYSNQTDEAPGTLFP